MLNANSHETGPVEMRLAAIRYAADYINLLEFRPLDGSLVAPFEAGAHVDLHLPNGLIRQYSLVNSQGETHRYVVGVKRDPQSRGGSSFLYEKLTVGTRLQVGRPRNNFHLNEDAEHSVLIAGGIGITPIWSMIQQLARRGKSWEIYYATRRRSEAAFADQLGQFGDRAHLHFDEECGGAVMNIETALANVVPTAHVYCCGPTPMLAAFEQATRSRPRSHVHLERFASSAPVVKIGACIVKLARSGKVVNIAAGQSILEGLRAQGINVSSSCEQGICGSCETRVLSGIPDHRDEILSPEEKAANSTMMICCSGSKSDLLVLDL